MLTLLKVKVQMDPSHFNVYRLAKEGMKVGVSGQ